MQGLLEFYTKHKRALTAIFGVLMITGAIAALYWTNSSSAASRENTKASKSIERMKAKGLIGGTSSSKSKKSSPKSLMSSYMEKKDEQNRVFLIILAIVGALSLLYSFFSKKDDKSLSAK